MKKYCKQIFAFLLSFVMLFAFLPTSAFAEEKPLYDISQDLYYGRNKLSTMENGENLVSAYDAIGAAVKNGETRISIEDYNIPYTEDMARMLLSIYNNDHPEDYLFPKSFSYEHTVKNGKAYIKNLFLNYYTNYNDHLFNRMAQRLLDAVSDKKSEYEKAVALYNMLEEYVEYDYSAIGVDVTDSQGMMAYSAYGAIVNGKAVCEGYAEAYQYLLQRLGIQSYIVTGQSKEGGNHEWNLLRLDGKYYYADITWDDVGRPDELHHSYFSITTERLLEGHIIEDPYGLLPDNLSTEIAYHYDNVFTEYDAAKLASIFKGDKKKVANFYFAGEEDYFDTWWPENYEAMFYQIKGLIPGTYYTPSYKRLGREYIVALTPEGYGATVGGKVLSWGDSSESTKVELFNLNDDTPFYTTYLEGNFNYWYIEDIAAGNYKARISKADHKTKEYTFSIEGELGVVDSSLFLLGDVNEDGIIDLRDIARAKVCIASSTALDPCDIDENGIVDAYDLIAVIEKLL